MGWKIFFHRGEKKVQNFQNFENLENLDYFWKNSTFWHFENFWNFEIFENFENFWDFENFEFFWDYRKFKKNRNFLIDFFFQPKHFRVFFWWPIPIPNFPKIPKITLRKSCDEFKDVKIRLFEILVYLYVAARIRSGENPTFWPLNFQIFWKISKKISEKKFRKKFSIEKIFFLRRILSPDFWYVFTMNLKITLNPKFYGFVISVLWQESYGTWTVLPGQPRAHAAVSVPNTGFWGGMSCMGAPCRIMLRWTSYSVYTSSRTYLENWPWCIG